MRFLDGPACGEVIDLQRAPHFLRVVIDADGKVDALDQLHDSPKPDEAIHVYLRQGKPHMVHMLCSPRSKSGWHLMADYKLYHHQPSDIESREENAWREWAAREWQICCDKLWY